ncbi:MAG: YceD family protein [Acidiferrobacterales bacterium]
MSAILPAAIDPIRLADEGSNLQGVVPVQAMSRLLELCRNPAAMVEVSLRFGRGTHGRMMEGAITTRLQLTCQRCLGVLEQDVVVTMHLGLLQTGESHSGLAEDADFIDVAPPVSLPELVEEEILLALPMTPMHPQGECPTAGTRRMGCPDTDAVTPARPLAALADLRRK